MAFLEETLGTSAANPKYRAHQRAAQRVLRALLPDQGAYIRGHALSRRQLPDVSGYARRPSDFEALLGILDGELHLITPTDPHSEPEEDDPEEAGLAGDEGRQGETSPSSPATQRRYQLTHDYLVPALRKWLARKQQETLRGRASLLLAGQAELCSARPERRYLPSFGEWAMISLLTRKSAWTDRERAMMRRSTRTHTLRLVLGTLLAMVLLVAGRQFQARLDAQRQESNRLVDLLVAELLMAEWDRVPQITEKLEPYRKLWQDRLRRTAGDASRPADQRIRAHLALAPSEPKSVPPLVERLLAVDDQSAEWRVLFRVLAAYPRHVELEAQKQRKRSPPGGSARRRRTQNVRAANACIALARLGDADVLWEELGSSERPGLRTRLIHRLHGCGVDGKSLIRGLTEANDASACQAVLLALEAYRDDGMSSKDRHDLIQQCFSLYRSHPDPGVHSAAEWLLARWGLSRQLEAARAELVGRTVGDWYVNGQEQTMIVIRAPSLPAFAIGAREVTIDEFARFRPAAPHADDVSPDGRCPMNKVTWLEAARYCRWLSEREGIAEDQMCYPPVDEITPGAALPDDFLERTGYRLPSEAEWERACGAATGTSRFFGESEEWLPEYASYDLCSEGHLWPVGTLKPNPWGLFDVYGNVAEWCHGPFEPSLAPDRAATPVRGEAVAVRGGAFLSPAKEATTFRREPQFFDSDVSFIGFRVARTVAP